MHELGGFEREFAVVFRAAMSHLPGAVHFVAEAPVGNFPGRFAAIFFTQARRRGVAREIDVLDPLLCVVPGTCAEVGADIRFRADARNVVEKLVRAESIVFDGAPSHFEASRTFIARPDAVAPVVIG